MSVKGRAAYEERLEWAADGSKLSKVPTFKESCCEEKLGRDSARVTHWKRTSVKISRYVSQPIHPSCPLEETAKLGVKAALCIVTLKDPKQALKYICPLLVSF